MILQNLHAHTTFDDGKNTVEEMARAAMAAGLTSFGFSAHSPAPFETSWTIPAARLPAYLAEVARVRALLEGQIAIYCGVEWDRRYPFDLAPFDYVIGSVHDVPKDGAFYSADESLETTRRYLREAFGGDADAAATAYFSQYASLAAVEEVDVVAHFDIITKFDEQGGFYRPDSPAFRKAATAAMEALVAAGKIFEINTGAIARGYRTSPYPSAPLLKTLCAMGGKATVSSDSHGAETVSYWFDRAERLAYDCGFRELWRLEGASFVPVPIDREG